MGLPLNSAESGVWIRPEGSPSFPAIYLICGAPMSPGIGSYIIEYFLEKEGATQRNCILTKREQEILKGIADGLTYKQLAYRLFISPYTVRTHIRNIYEKLHVRCKIEAVTKGKEEGVL